MCTGDEMDRDMIGHSLEHVQMKSFFHDTHWYIWYSMPLLKFKNRYMLPIAKSRLKEEDPTVDITLEVSFHVVLTAVPVLEQLGSMFVAHIVPFDVTVLDSVVFPYVRMCAAVTVERRTTIPNKLWFFPYDDLGKEDFSLKSYSRTWTGARFPFTAVPHEDRAFPVRFKGKDSAMLRLIHRLADIYFNTVGSTPESRRMCACYYLSIITWSLELPPVYEDLAHEDIWHTVVKAHQSINRLVKINAKYITKFQKMTETLQMVLAPDISLDIDRYVMLPVTRLLDRTMKSIHQLAMTNVLEVMARAMCMKDALSNAHATLETVRKAWNTGDQLDITTAILKRHPDIARALAIVAAYTVHVPTRTTNGHDDTVNDDTVNDDVNDDDVRDYASDMGDSSDTISDDEF